MAAPISNNPNLTRGRAAAAETSLRFPLSEDLSIGTRLRFVKYDRLAPSSTATDRTTALITLPLPLGVPDTYGMKIDDFKMGSFGNINQSNIDRAFSAGEAGWKEILSFGTNLVRDELSQQYSDLKSSALRGLALSPLISDSDTQRTVQSFAGIIKNPHTTMLFEGVDLRRFTLSWRLSARNAQEAAALDNIINTIKLRMHPEEAAGGYALDYPDLVYVEFTGSPSAYLPKFQKAFITNANVPSNNNGVMNFHKDGSPMEYEISISFVEMNILTRNILSGDKPMQ